MVNPELSITAAVSGVIIIAVFVAAIPFSLPGESQQSSFEVISPITKKFEAATTSAIQHLEQIYEIFIDLEGNVHVIHTIKESENPRKIKVINGTLSNLSVIGKDGNSIQYEISAIEPLEITIFPTEQQVLIEYDLDDVIHLINGRWTWNFFHLLPTIFFFPENVDLVFANSNPVPIVNNGLLCHGCDMVLEYVVDEPIILEKIEWKNQEFTVKIQTLAEVHYFVFDQPTKRIFLVVVSHNDPVSLTIPRDLLESPFDVYLNEKKIQKHRFVVNGTHVGLNFRPETPGAIDIVGSKAVGDVPQIKIPDGITTTSGPSISVKTQSLSFSELNEKGVELAKLGRFEEAIRYFDKALAISPDNWIVLHNKGKSLSALGEYQEALQYFDKALRIQPNSFMVLLNTGHTLYKIGESTEAIQFFDKAHNIDPNHPDPLFLKGLVLQDLGLFSEAIQYYDRALDINPNDAVVLHKKGRALFELGKYEEAIQSYEKSLVIVPHNVIALNDIGGALKKLGRLTEAIQYYDRALDINPNDAVVLHNKGRALSELGKYKDAMHFYEQSLLIKPKNPLVIEDKRKAFELLVAQLEEVPASSAPPKSEIPIGLVVSFIVLAITIGFASYSAVIRKH